MTGPSLYALTVGPLGFYLWLLALWQSDRHPRVVRGLVDFALLAIGVGGVLAFGPFGRLAARGVFGRTGLHPQLAVGAALGLLAALPARASLRRLVVYRVDAEALDRALRAALGRAGGRFTRTLGGFEAPDPPRGVRVEYTGWTRCAVVEAYGHDPEGLIREVRPALREGLRGTACAASRVAFAIYGCSVLVMLAPLVGLVLTQPKARGVFRALLERLRGA